MPSESSTGKPLAGFPRQASNAVPPLIRRVRRKIYFAGIPLRARTPAANDCLLLTTYAVENPDDTRTTTPLAASNWISVAGADAPALALPVGTNMRNTFPTATPADDPLSR